MVFKKKKKNEDLEIIEDFEEDIDMEEPEMEEEEERPRSSKTKVVRKNKPDVWVVRRVPKEWETAVVNLKTEDVLDEKAALARILKDLEEIKKALIE